MSRAKDTPKLSSKPSDGRATEHNLAANPGSRKLSPLAEFAAAGFKKPTSATMLVSKGLAGSFPAPVTIYKSVGSNICIFWSKPFPKLATFCGTHFAAFPTALCKPVFAWGAGVLGPVRAKGSVQELTRMGSGYGTGSKRKDGREEAESMGWAVGQNNFQNNFW